MTVLTWSRVDLPVTPKYTGLMATMGVLLSHVNVPAWIIYWQSFHWQSDFDNQGNWFILDWYDEQTDCYHLDTPNDQATE